MPIFNKVLNEYELYIVSNFKIRIDILWPKFEKLHSSRTLRFFVEYFQNKCFRWRDSLPAPPSWEWESNGFNSLSFNGFDIFNRAWPRHFVIVKTIPKFHSFTGRKLNIFHGCQSSELPAALWDSVAKYYRKEPREANGRFLTTSIRCTNKHESFTSESYE